MVSQLTVKQLKSKHDHDLNQRFTEMVSYVKIPILSPGLIFILKAFFLVDFFCQRGWVGGGGLIFRRRFCGAYIWEGLLSEFYGILQA